MEQEKQVVYFSDLFFAVLRRWKAMLAFALILALALGGFQLWKNSRKGDPAAAEEAAKAIEYNKAQLDTISANIFSQQKYMTESVLMTMDPYNSGKVTVDVYVYTDYQIMPGMEYQNTDKTMAVIRSYITALQTKEAQAAYAEATGIEVGYVSELITTETISNSNALCITVRCPTMEQAQKLADAVVAQLEGAQTTVADRITAHKISVVSNPTSEPVDQDVTKAQADAAVRLNNLNLSYTEAETALKTVQNYAADNQTTGPVIMAVLGAYAGAFLVAAWAIAVHLGSDKIYSGRVLENRVDIRVLGALPRKVTLLSKLEGRATTPLYDVIAMNIRNYCGEEKNVLLLGEVSGEYQTALTEQLQKLGITAIFDGSLLTTASSLEQLRGDNAVVLIYTCGNSRYSQAEKEISMVNDQKKALSGCILIGG